MYETGLTLCDRCLAETRPEGLKHASVPPFNRLMFSASLMDELEANDTRPAIFTLHDMCDKQRYCQRCRFLLNCRRLAAIVTGMAALLVSYHFTASP